MTTKIKSKLTKVPETMLWTLHNRATEAMRKDGIIKDSKCIKIYKTIDYNYEKSFGKAEPSHALRSIVFDKEIRGFLKNHHDGTIVNLGEGLETQRFRFDENNALWISVDLPDAIEIRERFIEPDEKHLHISFSALDRKWFDFVPKDKAVFITAQGLFMYFPEKEVKHLIQDISNTFCEGYLMFDVIPAWLSKKTMSEKGWKKTPKYTAPKMPWGINRNVIITKLKSWSTNIEHITEITAADFPRGILKWLAPLILSIPILNRYAPTSVKIKFRKNIKWKKV